MEKNEKIQLVEELHKPARRNYPRWKVDIRGFDETWQADLVDMKEYVKDNNGYKYILTVIDNFSKFAWAVPVKTKTGLDVTEAMRKVLIKGRVPQKLHVDQGKEFYNKNFQNLMKDYNIHMYSTFSNVKASICERFNRTLKEKMWKKFSLHGSYKWVKILPDLIVSYNTSKHSTIKMKPIDVTMNNEREIFQRFYKKPIACIKKIKFQVNDKVRISRYKHPFEKGYTPNWTTEIFTIKHVQKTIPTTYLLEDDEGAPIQGAFYEAELNKVKYPDVYLVEKIIKKCGNKVLVKWLGLDRTRSTWEYVKDVL